MDPVLYLHDVQKNWTVNKKENIMKNSEVIKVTKGRQREALKIVKRIEARLIAYQTDERTNWGHAGSMGALWDKLIETETFTDFLK
jgi:predicted glycosyltransferase involved in capsule biosynthesis